MQVALDQRYVSAADINYLQDLCRRTSGMISNSIAHLQSSNYPGEKLNRPRRKAIVSREERMAAVRAAQLANSRKPEMLENDDQTPES